MRSLFLIGLFSMFVSVQSSARLSTSARPFLFTDLLENIDTVICAKVVLITHHDAQGGIPERYSIFHLEGSVLTPDGVEEMPHAYQLRRREHDRELIDLYLGKEFVWLIHGNGKKRDPVVNHFQIEESHVLLRHKLSEGWGHDDASDPFGYRYRLSTLAKTIRRQMQLGKMPLADITQGYEPPPASALGDRSLSETEEMDEIFLRLILQAPEAFLRGEIATSIQLFAKRHILRGGNFEDLPNEYKSKLHQAVYSD